MLRADSVVEDVLPEMIDTIVRTVQVYFQVRRVHTSRTYTCLDLSNFDLGTGHSGFGVTYKPLYVLCVCVCLSTLGTVCFSS